MSDLTMQEMRELQIELDQISEDFADLEDIFGKQAFNFDEDEGDSEELDALDVELENSGLVSADTQSVGELSLMGLADGLVDEQTFTEQGWFPNPLKIIIKKARKIIRKIVALVKRYKKYAKCVPAVRKAVVLFKKKKYYSALKQAYSALKCIKNT